MTLSNAIGAIGSMLGNFSFSQGGGTSVDDSRWLMGEQSKLWRGDTQWLNENGWKQLRKGLIDADYNPLLALGTSPQSAPMTSATAQEGMRAYSQDPASGITANVAKDMSKSQISLNKATARKTNQEAITQQNIRSNLNADTALKMAQKIWGDTKLPYETKLMYTQQLMNIATANLNQTTANWIPFNSKSGRITARANETTAKTNAQWTPVQIGAGIGMAGAGLLGFGIGKLKSMFKRPVGFR